MSEFSGATEDPQRGIATFYGYLGRRATRKPLGDAIERLPGDWGELKEMIIERMMIAHVQHQQDQCLVALDKHLGGKFVYEAGAGGYGQERTRWRREVLGMWLVRYHYKTNMLTVRNARFGPELATVAEEFWALERGVTIKVPRLIPKELEHPDITLMQPAPPRYADYSKQPHLSYGEHGSGGYAQPLKVCHYLPRDQRMREATRRK